MSGRRPLTHLSVDLTNAPAAFQPMINDVLRDYLNLFVCVYLDDMPLFSKDLDEHKQHVRKVLQRLLENKLRVKAEKCEFHASSVSFFGYILERRWDQHWQSQRSNKLGRSFHMQRLLVLLRFASFYIAVIRDYRKVFDILTEVTSISVPFVWSSEAAGMFQCSLEEYTSAPVHLPSVRCGSGCLRCWGFIAAL